jgi:hypothetical protein
VLSGNRHVGSNPTLSANSHLQRRGVLAYLDERNLTAKPYTRESISSPAHLVENERRREGRVDVDLRLQVHDPLLRRTDRVHACDDEAHCSPSAPFRIIRSGVGPLSCFGVQLRHIERALRGSGPAPAEPSAGNRKPGPSRGRDVARPAGTLGREVR